MMLNAADLESNLQDKNAKMHTTGCELYAPCAD